MMQAEELTEGVIVFDPTAPVPSNKAYFRVVSAKDAELGPWVLEQLAGGKRRTIHLPLLADLEPHEADSGLMALIGKKVRFTLRFGSSAMGVFECVEYLELAIDQQVLQIPVSFLLDGEVYPIKDVAGVKVLDET